jgi:phosphatidate cytidylyltransferase
MKKFIIGIPMGLLVLLLLYLGGIFYLTLIFFAVYLATREWWNITVRLLKRIRLTGYIYLVSAAAAVFFIREKVGFMPAFWLIAIVVATDVGGQYGGRFFGKKFFSKSLAEDISPNKTWEGLFGGMLLASLTGMIFAIFGGSSYWLCGFESAILAVIAQLGDLAESWAKRQAGIKDSGSTLGAHGGILDRVDGHLAVNLLVGVSYFILGWKWIIPF